MCKLSTIFHAATRQQLPHDKYVTLVGEQGAILQRQRGVVIVVRQSPDDQAANQQKGVLGLVFLLWYIIRRSSSWQRTASRSSSECRERDTHASFGESAVFGITAHSPVLRQPCRPCYSHGGDVPQPFLFANMSRTDGSTNGCCFVSSRTAIMGGVSTLLSGWPAQRFRHIGCNGHVFSPNARTVFLHPHGRTSLLLPIAWMPAKGPSIVINF